MKKYSALILGLLVLALSTPCLAEGEEEATPLTKLERGIENVATGWTEIPEEIHESLTEEDNKIVGLVEGTVKGSAEAAAKTTAGAIETGTFVVPEYDEPILEVD